MRTMTSPSILAFLHTAPANVEMFDRLVASVDPAIQTEHELVERIMQEAARLGRITDEMRRDTQAAIDGLAARGATMIVCTCSTIGGVAEALSTDALPVMRVDRPMAQAAVRSGRRIIVAATLESTVKPTRELLEKVAAEEGRGVTLVECLCADAWPFYQRGDARRYAQAIANTVAMAATPSDIVVLAQASMAPAAAVLEARGLTALASPELGVRTAVARFKDMPVRIVRE
jgi:Asp/Glu/hydantoin racemase